MKHHESRLKEMGLYVTHPFESEDVNRQPPKAHDFTVMRKTKKSGTTTVPNPDYYVSLDELSDNLNKAYKLAFNVDDCSLRELYSLVDEKKWRTLQSLRVDGVSVGEDIKVFSTL